MQTQIQIPIKQALQQLHPSLQKLLPNSQIHSLLLLQNTTQSIDPLSIFELIKLQLRTQQLPNSYVKIESLNFRLGKNSNDYEIESYMREKATKIKDVIKDAKNIQNEIRQWMMIGEQAIRLLLQEKRVLIGLDPSSILFYVKVDDGQKCQLLLGFQYFGKNHQEEHNDGLKVIMENNFGPLMDNVKFKQAIFQVKATKKQEELKQLSQFLINKIEQLEVLTDVIQDPYQCFYRVLSHYCQYIQNTFQLCNQILTPILNKQQFVFYQKIRKNLSMLSQIQVQLTDPQIKQILQEQIYFNPNCKNLHGFCRSTFFSQERCPICRSHFPAQHIRKQKKQSYRSHFLEFLANNCLGIKVKSINLNLSRKIFTLGVRDGRFTHYPHFRQYLKIKSNTRNRPIFQPTKALQMIPLFIKGNTSRYNLISVPLRGKYCQHLQFFDPSEVWIQYNGCIPHEITCPFCKTNIQIDEIVHCREMKMVMRYFENLLSAQALQSEAYLKIDHEKERCWIIWREDHQKNERSQQIFLYQIIIDPLSRIKGQILPQQIEIQFPQFFEL